MKGTYKNWKESKQQQQKKKLAKFCQWIKENTMQKAEEKNKIKMSTWNGDASELIKNELDDILKNSTRYKYGLLRWATYLLCTYVFIRAANGEADFSCANAKCKFSQNNPVERNMRWDKFNSAQFFLLLYSEF